MNHSGHIISGHVVDDEQRPLDQARVMFAMAPVPTPDIAALTGPDGAFAIDAPVAGSYSIQVVCDQYQPHWFDVEVGGGQSTGLFFRLRKS